MTQPPTVSSWLLALLGAWVSPGLGCGSTAFTLAASDGGVTDSRSGADTSPSNDAPAPADVRLNDAGDATAPEAGDCPPPTASNVYVAGHAPFNGNGSSVCPFTDVASGVNAVTAAAKEGTESTVNVAAGFYTVAAVTLPPHVSLLGAGEGMTTLSSSNLGSCLSSPWDAPCAIILSPGSALENVTVSSTMGNGILVRPALDADANPPLTAPALANDDVTGCTGSGTGSGFGIVALGDVDVGPNVHANMNASDGLFAAGSGTVHVKVASTSPANQFDNNGMNGIELAGNTKLIFDGGTLINNALSGLLLGQTIGAPANTLSSVVANINGTSGALTGGNGLEVTGSANVHVLASTPTSTFNSNKQAGIVFTGTSTGILTFDGGTASMNVAFGVNLLGTGNTNMNPHGIVGLVANGNGEVGLSANRGQMNPLFLVLRNCDLTGNTQVGLDYNYGSITQSPSLDIGGGASVVGGGSSGGNRFGASSPIPARGAGVRLCNAAGAATQPAVGDTFAHCTLSSHAIDSGCTTVPATYLDVAYTNAPGSTTPLPGDPIVPLACPGG